MSSTTTEEGNLTKKDLVNINIDNQHFYSNGGFASIFPN